VVLFGREVGDRENFPDDRIVLIQANRALAFEPVHTYELSPQPNLNLTRLAKRIAYGGQR